MANEKRLIDAYKLEDLIRSNSARYHHADDVIAAIAGQPTVDAVEVVRCKDCKKWEQFEPMFDERRGTCLNPKFHMHYGHVVERCWMPITQIDDFCSYGERKEGE